MLKQGGKTGNRGPSTKGKVMIDTVNGQERVRKWPRKRTGKLKAITKQQNNWFLQANWATKYITSLEMNAAMDAVAGTPMLPRDILLMNFAGRLFSYTSETGKVIYPMASVISVSQSLDIIGSQPGSMLIRGPSVWETAPAPSGNMGASAASVLPRPAFDWSDGSRLDGHQCAITSAAISAPTVLNGVTLARSATAVSQRLCAAIYAVNALGYAGALLAQGAIITAPAGLGTVDLPFADPVIFNEPTPIWIGIAELDGLAVRQPQLSYNRVIRFFSQKTSVLPDPAPAQQTAAATWNNWWTY